MMYPERKQEFENMKNNSQDFDVNYMAYFKTLEFMEEIKNKDLSEFTKDEIVTAYKFLNSASLSYLKVLNSTFNMYTQYCIEMGCVNINPYSNIDLAILSECLNKDLVKNKVFSYDVIKSICNNPMVAPREAFMFIALFEGLKGKGYSELTNLKKQDIDFDNHIFHLDSRDIKVDDFCLNSAKKAIECEYTYGYGKGNRVIELFDSDYILRQNPFCGNPDKKQIESYVVSRSVKKILDLLFDNNVANVNDIVNSGKLYMIKEKAKELGVTPIEFINSPNIKYVNEQFNCNIIKKTFINNYKDHLK